MEKGWDSKTRPEEKKRTRMCWPATHPSVQSAMLTYRQVNFRNSLLWRVLTKVICLSMGTSVASLTLVLTIRMNRSRPYKASAGEIHFARYNGVW
jgi:hypothetical protein